MENNTNTWGFTNDDIPASNWFKFEKIGDRINGKIIDIFDQKGENGFADQKVFTLLTADGSEVNVPINKNRTYLVQATKNWRPGDIAGFEFTKEIPPSQKGYAPAKSITPFIKKTPEGDAIREAEKNAGPF